MRLPRGERGTLYLAAKRAPTEKGWHLLRRGTLRRYRSLSRSRSKKLEWKALGFPSPSAYRIHEEWRRRAFSLAMDFVFDKARELLSET